jgi:hypothetical protein
MSQATLMGQAIPKTRGDGLSSEGAFLGCGDWAFHPGLCATTLNPSGASILDLKQRTKPSNKKAGG